MSNDKEEMNERRHIIWSARKRLWCGLPWTFTVYSLSSDRLFLKRGIFNLKEDEVRLYRIKDIALRRSFIQRIFGLGTVKICSTDSSLRDFELKNLKDSEAVKEKLSEHVEAERDRKRVSMREFLGHGDHGDGDFENFDAFDALDHA